MTVTNRFEARAAASPEAVALIANDRTCTYRALNARANRLAWHLRERGVGPETIVGICIPRSIDFVVALLAVAKAGGAYLAIDVDHPRQRAEWMLRDTGARLLLATADTRGLVCAAPVIVLTELDEVLDHQRHDNPASPASPDGLFKVVYTSGSTGRPKGVLVPMRAVLHRLDAMAARFPFVNGDVALLHRSSMIAGSSWDALGPLIAGVPTLVMPTFDPMDAAVWELVARTRVSHLAAGPSLWHLILTMAERSAVRWDALRMVIVGGERASRKLVTRFARAFPHASLVNIYGLTESIYPCGCDATLTAACGSYVPAGGPFPDVSVAVVDDAGRAQPHGTSGHICLAGPGTARGYLHAPSLTAEKFAPNPSGATPGERMFRTGDRGRWRADGVLEVLGRRDNQVKVRGTRVELAEVEAVLSASPGVSEAAVTSHTADEGESRIVGYVVPEPGVSISIRELRASLARALPAGAVPAAFVVLAEMPITSQGKVDRARLPAPATTGADDRHSGPAPRTNTERAIARIWRELLNVPQVGVHDDFISLGGTSLAGMYVASRIRQEFGISLSFDTVLGAPGLDALASYVDAAQERKAHGA
ncbi:MAG: non-ribosomal peptide synthetase [Vicinamibacterales bacterium]